jgi:beta-galactosamide-alpha-2,3-sialyltransferase
LNNKSLFICNTPLQCLIATKIIELKFIKKKECILLFYNSNKNDQLLYNFNNVKNKFDKSFYCKIERKFPFYLYDLYNLIKNINIESIYLASIDSIYIQYIISKNLNKNIYTFDDGTANISNESHYYKNKLSLTKRIILYCFFDMKNIREIILKESINHFTIFKYEKNYVGNFFINVNLNFVKKNKELKVNKNECSILLGTVENEALKDLDLKIIEFKYAKLKKMIKHDFYYFPHPRGNIRKIDQYINITNNLLISEFKILKLLDKYSHINIYGFSSTVQLNLKTLENIEIIFLKSYYESDLISNIRNIFTNKQMYSNIKTIDFDKL